MSRQRNIGQQLNDIKKYYESRSLRHGAADAGRGYTAGKRKPKRKPSEWNKFVSKNYDAVMYNLTKNMSDQAGHLIIPSRQDIFSELGMLYKSKSGYRARGPTGGARKQPAYTVRRARLGLPDAGLPSGRVGISHVGYQVGGRYPRKAMRNYGSAH